jgi:hypothetical protein
MRNKIEFLQSISYPSVLGTAIAGMVIGFVWYSDFLFAQKWMALSKVSVKQMENNNMTLSASLGFGVTLILSFCLAAMYHYFQSLDSALMALQFIIFFMAIEELGGLIWEKKPVMLYLINVGHKAISWLVILLVYVALQNMLS